MSVGGSRAEPRPAGPAITDVEDPRVAAVVVSDDQLVADAIAALVTRELPSLVLTARSARSLLTHNLEPGVSIIRPGTTNPTSLAADARILGDAGWRVLVVAAPNARGTANHDATANPDGRMVADTTEPRVGMLTAEAGADALVAELRAMLPNLGPEPKRPGRVASPEVSAGPAEGERGLVLLSAQERRILLGYVEGLTLSSAARAAGVRPGTAKKYLERIKAKYAEAGRPARTKIELARRAREDDLLSTGIAPPPRATDAGPRAS